MKEETNKISLLAQWKKRQQESAVKGIEKAPEDAPLVLSHGQQRLWFLQQLYPGNPFYNYSHRYDLKGVLDIENLSRALQIIYDTQDILRTTYELKDGIPQAIVHHQGQLNLKRIDLREHEDLEAETLASKEMNEDSLKSFDLTKGPLIRVSLLKLSEKNHILFITLHHIVGDKWSLEIFNQKLAKYYRNLSESKDEVFEKPSIQYQDYAHWQLKKPIDQSQLDYWTEKLSGEIPMLDLPKDFKAPLQPSFKGGLNSQLLDEKLSKKILSLASELDTTPYVLLLSVYYVQLFRYTQQNDILVGSPISNRNQKALEELMGFFNDTVVLRAKLETKMSFKELVAQVRNMTLEAFENNEVPFETLVKTLKPKRSLSTNPFFQVMFLYDSVENTPSFGTELEVSSETYASKVSKFDLTLFMYESNGSITSCFEYATDLFEGDTIDRMQKHLRLLLNGVVENPEQSISDILMITEEEKRLFFPETYENRLLVNTPKSLTAFIDQASVNFSSKQAVVFKDKSISYEELNWKAENLAHYILEQKSNQEGIVALCMDRSLEMIIGMLGILKAGCAYLPLDSEYPSQRLNFMLNDAKVDLILTRRDTAPKLQNSSVALMNIDELDLNTNQSSNQLPDIQPDDLAYVIYTSGSTGQPKGVPITHSNIVNSTLGRTQFYGNDPESFLLLSSLSFDSSKAGVFWTLCTGGTLVISEKRMEQDINLLSQTIQNNNVTHTLMLPSLYNLLLDHASIDELESLELVMVAGEACSHLVCKKHFDTLPRVALYNEYGPTEATVWCVAHKIQKEDGVGPIPIGKPVAGAQVHILNDDLKHVPYGSIGELCVSGPGLTKGYINASTNMNASFAEIRLHPDTSQTRRIYRTGDLARYGKNGNIEFFGRKDQQVKVRGHRIEIDEIEKVILDSKVVEKVVVAIEGKEVNISGKDFGEIEMAQLLKMAKETIGIDGIEELLNDLENRKDSELEYLMGKI